MLCPKCNLRELDEKGNCTRCFYNKKRDFAKKCKDIPAAAAINKHIFTEICKIKQSIGEA